MFKCGLCSEQYTTSEALMAHYEEDHADAIPKDFETAQFDYMLKKGRKHGNCVVCKQETQWNSVTNKYHRFCNKPSCKEKYRQMFMKRMIGKHGKIHLLNDPDQQRKMLANRAISGEYKWSDGKMIPYTGTYEKDFLQFLDVFMNFPSSDIMSPSPHTYYYIHEGVEKFYIPDFFIPSLNLEIEIKDGGDNPNNHHKIQEVDKKKEALKDKVMTSQTSFSYIKLVNKKYEPFFDFLFKKKEMNSSDEKDKPIFIVDSPTGSSNSRQTIYESTTDTTLENF